jgi:hypothetical protein
LRVHGFALGLPNPGLLSDRSERARAEEAITETVRALRRELLERSTAGAVRRFVGGDPIRQLTRRVGSAASVQAM